MVNGENGYFPFEKLETYQKALLFTQRVFSVTKDCRHLAWISQFQRAAMSVVLNIAEGGGRTYPKEKKILLDRQRLSIRVRSFD